MSGLWRRGVLAAKPGAEQVELLLFSGGALAQAEQAVSEGLVMNKAERRGSGRSSRVEHLALKLCAHAKGFTTRRLSSMSMHGGASKGAEMIAARWADPRGETQTVFKPDWKSHGKAVTFKRNDKMLEPCPKV